MPADVGALLQSDKAISVAWITGCEGVLDWRFMIRAATLDRANIGFVAQTLR
ncbi:hypothetical protein J2S49_001445 [Arcanobacterium wilhelmae]|uniref:Uncharacterized protein n=1 Tax=Arcanobacterium wilhelmae TaxID=1803177 RepID=A0ABT9NCC7_9ACTO|nr:hypothetical protein [Arcanobacterium wilhelmae]